jgi:hypothetical protein
MKKLIIGIIFLSSFLPSCSNDAYDSIIAGDAPFKGTSTDKVFAESGNKKIILKDIKLGESNFYYSFSSSVTELFLVNYCSVDCNEKMLKSGWSLDNGYYAFLIGNSNRYKATTRFVVFKLTTSDVQKIFDLKEDKITDFTMLSGEVKYTNAQNDVKSLKLP